jgi:hypothetical protein
LYHVYEGNVPEPITVAEMLRDLGKGHAFLAQKPTMVMVAGIATEDGKKIRKDKYLYPN